MYRYLHNIEGERGVCVRKEFAELKNIDTNEPISMETHYEFLHCFQNALLLALREQGYLNLTQYSRAEEKLKQQRIGHARKLLEKEEKT